MAVIPLRKDQPPPREPLRKLTVSRIGGRREWGAGVSYQMIAASDGSIELISDRKSIHIADGKRLRRILVAMIWSRGRTTISACGGSMAVATARGSVPAIRLAGPG